MKQIFIILLFLSHMVHAQFEVNYTEAKVPQYALPEILKTKNGTPIKTIKQWNRHRDYLLKLFIENKYGPNPNLQPKVHYELIHEKEVFNGKAIQRQIAILFDDFPTLSPINILIYLPKNKINPVVFFGLNFEGNHSLSEDKDIEITKNWVNDYQKNAAIVKDNRATEASRNSAIIETWPFEKIIDAGFAVATAFHADIEPDRPDGWQESLRNFITEKERKNWSTMGVWAWGLRQMVNYLESDADLAKGKKIIIGHSRMGKAALWAAAQDIRIDGIISNESGEGGAALSKREYGETIEIINSKFPHWFSENYKKFNKNSAGLPFDSHQLLGLMAPRPLYVSSAEGDQWADPTGEFLALKEANPVYALFGKKGIIENIQPPVNQPIGQYNKYHYRSGKHYLNEYDWAQYLDWAKDNFR